MRNSMDFIIPGEPQGKGRPRFARAGQGVRTYTPKKTDDYEELIRACWRQAGGKKFEGHIGVYVQAVFELPKSASKKTKAEMLANNIRPTKKPDIDNIAKVVFDALNGLAYGDDAQITNGTLVKKYGEEAHVKVVLAGEKSEFKRFTGRDDDGNAVVIGCDLDAAIKALNRKDQTAIRNALNELADREDEQEAEEQKRSRP